MHELDLAMQASTCILPVFYRIEGEKCWGYGHPMKTNWD
jgi:hypothetical protein